MSETGSSTSGSVSIYLSDYSTELAPYVDNEDEDPTYFPDEDISVSSDRPFTRSAAYVSEF
jgi:hypothetical protein